MLRLKLNDRPRSVEREVDCGGKFKIKIGTPNIEERFRYRSLLAQFDNRFGELATFTLGFLIGWDGITDENGQAIEFNELNKGKILHGNDDISEAISGTIAAYFNENVVEIITEDDAKNSEQPPGNSTEVATPTAQPLPSIVT